MAGYSVFNKSPSERPYSVREEAEGPKQIETGNLARQGTAEPVEPHADVWRFCSMRGVGSTEPEVSATRIRTRYGGRASILPGIFRVLILGM